eukprot:scaffold65949_cov51-Attheya_sp.AAC.5
MPPPPLPNEVGYSHNNIDTSKESLVTPAVSWSGGRLARADAMAPRHYIAAAIWFWAAEGVLLSRAVEKKQHD